MANIFLYEAGGFQGKTLSLTSATSSFVTSGMDNKVSSIEVQNGVWTVYEDVNYEGLSITLKVGKYDTDYIQSKIGNNVISSARPAEIILYDAADFEGNVLKLYDDTPDLIPLGFNDIVTCIEVTFGVWIVYEATEYERRSLSLNVGKYDMDYISKHLGNDVISSVKLTPSAKIA